MQEVSKEYLKSCYDDLDRTKRTVDQVKYSRPMLKGDMDKIHTTLRKYQDLLDLIEQMNMQRETSQPVQPFLETFKDYDI